MQKCIILIHNKQWLLAMVDLAMILYNATVAIKSTIIPIEITYCKSECYSHCCIFQNTNGCTYATE